VYVAVHCVYSSELFDFSSNDFNTDKRTAQTADFAAATL